MEYRPPPQQKFISEKPTPWWYLIPFFIFLPVVFLFLRSFGSSGPDALATIAVGGGGVLEDEVLAQRFAGSVRVSDEMVVALACQNGVEWSRDVSLSPDTLIASDPGLVRAAELVAAGAFTAGFVETVEELMLPDGVPTQGADDERFRALDTDLVANYLAARSEPPDPSAVGRFGVYVASVTTTRRHVVFVDRESLDRQAIWEFSVDGEGVDVGVAGDGGVRRVSAGDCRDFAGDAFESASSRFVAGLRAIAFFLVFSGFAIGFGMFMRASTEPWWSGGRRIEPATVRQIGWVPIGVGLLVFVIAVARLCLALID